MTNYIKFLLVTTLFIFFINPVTAAVLKDSDSFTVIIDAGHGGKDVGAVDNGAREKDINLGVAKKLAGMIKKNLKNVKLIMTRDDDSYLTLQERADIANKNKGDLFISIHTNSIDKSNPNRSSIQGSSVYALGLHKDQNNLQVARRENSVIELESNFEQKYSGFDPSKDESYIIFEMAQKKNLSQSLKFANLAQKNLVSVAGRSDKGVKQAGFWVLWATSMPSVLVELDFICNQKSAQFLVSDSGQEKLARALYNAIEKYFKAGNSSTGKEMVITSEGNEKIDETPILVSMPAEKKDLNYSSKNNSVSQSIAPRKRRSAASKRVSDAREIETSDIRLHNENERLAIIQKPEIVDDNDNTSLVTTIDRDNKKIPHNKTNPKSLVDKTLTKSTTYKPRQSHIQTVYKIQILASKELLKQNNPCFCGLSPIKSFKERGQYKYTYGESKDKSEIEKLLVDVRKMIPDAFIIKNLR